MQYDYGRLDWVRGGYGPNFRLGHDKRSAQHSTACSKFKMSRYPRRYGRMATGAEFCDDLGD